MRRLPRQDGAAEYHDVPLLRDRVLCSAISLSPIGRNCVAIVAYGAIAATIIGLLGPIFYSVSCLRQARLVVLGMAQGLSRFSFYKSWPRHAECSLSCSHQLLHSTGPELVRPFINSPDLATSCSSGAGQHLHPFQVPTMTHSLFTAVLAGTAGVWA